MTDTANSSAAPAAAVLVKAGDTDVQKVSDPKMGDYTYRTLVSSHAGPSAALVHGIAMLDKGGSEPMHRHDIPETAHVLSGRGTVRIEEVTHDVAQGDTVFIPAGMPHAWDAPDDALEIFYSFPADSFPDIAYHYGDSDGGGA